MRSKTLRKRATFQIRPTPPFHFDGTFHKPSHFPAPLNTWQPGRFWQTLRVGRRLYGIRIDDVGTNARLRVSVFHSRSVSAPDLETLKSELVWRFDLDANLREFARLARKDRHTRAVFRRWRGTRDSCFSSLYELFVIAILLQNATIRRTVQMMRALLDAFGTRLTFDSQSLFAMWRPEDLAGVSEDELRALKIGYRARFLKRLSDDFSRGIVNEIELRALDLEQARKALLKLYGVGPETARILLYPACHRYAPLSHIAPWQQKIYSRLFYDQALVPTRRILKDLNARYGDYASLAVAYVWEDLFWRHSRAPIPWLQKEIRL
ncbi:MAG: DNA-3-methyladenine glycosylase family protein [Candidatus Binataceae bacterium]